MGRCERKVADVGKAVGSRFSYAGVYDRGVFGGIVLADDGLGRPGTFPPWKGGCELFFEDRLLVDKWIGVGRENLLAEESAVGSGAEGVDLGVDVCEEILTLGGGVVVGVGVGGVEHIERDIITGREAVIGVDLGIDNLGDGGNLLILGKPGEGVERIVDGRAESEMHPTLSSVEACGHVGEVLVLGLLVGGIVPLLLELESL